jgi:hypothetical protein
LKIFFVLYNLELNYPCVINLLKEIKKDEIDKLFSIILYFRNPALSTGYKKLSRWLYQWHLVKYPDILYENIDKIIQNGRWDDILYLFPQIVKLNNIDNINKNFITNINEKDLEKSKIVQNKIIEYVCDNLLKEFKNYSKGLPISNLAKWLPSENSSFNRKYNIVNQICLNLDISLHDYRVIYITPMRKYLNVCESYMCNNEWKYIDYEKLSTNSLKKYSNAFKRHDFIRFNNWKKEKKKLSNIKKPHVIINNYLNNILKNHKKLSKDSLLEVEWHENKDLIIDNIQKKYIIITDTCGNMYNKHNEIRFISYSIAIAILSSNNLDGKFKNKVFNITSNNINTINLDDNILMNIVNIRMSFTIELDINTLIDNIHKIKNNDEENFPKNIIYITSKEVKINEKIKDIDENLLIWNICDKQKKYKKINNITFLHGFRDDFFYSVLSNGEYKPGEIIKNIIR